MKKTQRTNTDADEEKRLKPFVCSNQDKEFVVLLSLLIQSSREFGHVCRRPERARAVILSYVSHCMAVRGLESGGNLPLEEASP